MISIWRFQANSGKWLVPWFLVLYSGAGVPYSGRKLESWRKGWVTLNKLILLFCLMNFVEWVVFMLLTKHDLKILIFFFKNLTYKLKPCKKLKNLTSKFKKFKKLKIWRDKNCHCWDNLWWIWTQIGTNIEEMMGYKMVTLLQIGINYLLHIFNF